MFVILKFQNDKEKRCINGEIAMDENPKKDSKGSPSEFFEQFSQKFLSGGLLPKDILKIDDRDSELMYSKAYHFYNSGNYEESCRLFQMLMGLNPSEYKYVMGLAACYLMMRDIENALKFYTLAGALDPHAPLPHFHSAECFLQAGDRISALVALEMTITRTKGKPELKELADRSAMMTNKLTLELAQLKEL